MSNPAKDSQRRPKFLAGLDLSLAQLSPSLFPTLLQISCKQAYSHGQREWIFATLGLEEEVILEDGPSGLIKYDLTNHPPHSRRNHPTHHIAGATTRPPLTWIVSQQPLS